MKKNYNFLLLLVLLVLFNNIAISQTSLGTCSSFISKLKKELTVSTERKEKKSILLQIADSKNFSGKINYKQSSTSSEFLIGEIENISESSFYLKVMGQSLEGHIILKKSKEAFKYSSDAKGNAYVSKVDINSLICVDYINVSQNEVKTTKVSSTTISPDLLKLESLPGGLGCILLDFDGYYMPAGNVWNNGGAIYANPSGMSDAKILQCFEIVSEDYSPFNLNITTNEAVFNTYPKTKRKRIVITPTDTAGPGGGGIALIGSFTLDTDIPAWCFNISTGKSAGDTASHEIGHLFSLKHDGRTSPREEYFSGLSETSWAPIMGAAFVRPVSQWSKGEYNSANNIEDDVAIISDKSFGVGYRVDDYGNDIASAFNLTLSSKGGIIQRDGVIEKDSDKDFFAFTTAGGSVNIEASTLSRIGSGNLHILIQLYNSAGIEIEQYSDPDPYYLNASMYANLPAGKYFISISGVGAGEKGYGGYSSYGSVGSYSISGTVPISPVLDISISGSQTNVSCYGASDGSITINTSGGAGSFTYVWLPSGGTEATASNLKAGNYTVTVTDKNGGSKTENFSIIQPAMLDSGITVESEKLIANQSGAIYQWFECPASPIAGEIDQSFKPKKGGSYMVMVTLNNCKVSSGCVDFNSLKTASFDEKLKFMLYPNPCNKILTIRSDHDADLKFINALGETVKKVKVLANANDMIDVESLSSGIYFVCEIKEGELISHKFIKN